MEMLRVRTKRYTEIDPQILHILLIRFCLWAEKALGIEETLQ